MRSWMPAAGVLLVGLVLFCAGGAHASHGGLDFDQGVSATAVLEEARANARVQLTPLRHSEMRLRKLKARGKLKTAVAGGVYAPVSPLITNSAAYPPAVTLHGDARYQALATDVLQPLERDWSQIQSVRSDLSSQASAWDGQNEQLGADRDQLQADRSALDQRQANLNSAVDQFNQQCTGRPLPPDEYQRCSAWRDSLVQQQTQLQTDIDQFNGRVDSWNGQSQSIFQQRGQIVGQIQAWETQIKNWMDAVQKAIEAQCRPLKQLEARPPIGRVPTGGSSQPFEARTFYYSEPSGAPPCPVDLLWTFTPHPDIPNTVIGVISPTTGPTTTFTSGNFTGTGTLVVQDTKSGIGTSANVSIYNPAVR